MFSPFGSPKGALRGSELHLIKHVFYDALFLFWRNTVEAFAGNIFFLPLFAFLKRAKKTQKNENPQKMSFNIQTTLVAAATFLFMCNDMRIKDDPDYVQIQKDLASSREKVLKANMEGEDANRAAVQSRKQIEKVAAAYHLKFGVDGESYISYVRQLAANVSAFSATLTVPMKATIERDNMCIVCDVDETLLMSQTLNDLPSRNVLFPPVADLLRTYAKIGFKIIILTARIVPPAGDVGFKNALDEHGIPTHAIHYSKRTPATVMSPSAVYSFCVGEKRQRMKEILKDGLCIFASIGDSVGDIYEHGRILLLPRPFRMFDKEIPATCLPASSDLLMKPAHALEMERLSKVAAEVGTVKTINAALGDQIRVLREMQLGIEAETKKRKEEEKKKEQKHAAELAEKAKEADENYKKYTKSAASSKAMADCIRVTKGEVEELKKKLEEAVAEEKKKEELLEKEVKNKEYWQKRSVELITDKKEMSKELQANITRNIDAKKHWQNMEEENKKQAADIAKAAEEVAYRNTVIERITAENQELTAEKARHKTEMDNEGKRRLNVTESYNSLSAQLRAAAQEISALKAEARKHETDIENAVDAERARIMNFVTGGRNERPHPAGAGPSSPLEQPNKRIKI
jgi:hypothetical protein